MAPGPYLVPVSPTLSSHTRWTPSAAGIESPPQSPVDSSTPGVRLGNSPSGGPDCVGHQISHQPLIRSKPQDMIKIKNGSPSNNSFLYYLRSDLLEYNSDLMNTCNAYAPPRSPSVTSSSLSSPLVVSSPRSFSVLFPTISCPAALLLWLGR